MTRALSQRNLLLASSSVCHPGSYLEHLRPYIAELFDGVGEILFVPFARAGGRTHDEYTSVARAGFEPLGIGVRGLHEFEDAEAAIAAAGGVFVGGGNTFVLLRQLYVHNVLGVLRERGVAGMPYMGCSAGSNIAGLTMGTSNDMPINYPPSFDALGLIPFNLNPHFPALPPDPTHKGETREERIAEFHCFNSQRVLGLREDGLLRIRGQQIELIGQRNAILFQQGQASSEFTPGDDLSFLLKE